MTRKYLLVVGGSLLAAIAGPVASTSAQAVHVVDQAGGPGSSYTTIGAAVAAAVDDDVLLVKTGYYPEVVTLDGLGVILQAEIGSSVQIDRIQVLNLLPSQHAAIRGLQWRGCYDEGLELRDNDGVVWVESASSVCSLGSEFATVTGTITGSASVVLRDCLFGDPLSVLLNGVTSAQPGLYIVDSEVALYACTVVGQKEDFFEGPPGLHLDRSLVTVYGSMIHGGGGADEFLGSGPSRGGPGAVLEGNSILDVFDSTIDGGQGGHDPSGPPALSGVKYQVISGTVNELPDKARTLSVPSPLRWGESTPFTFTGEPDDRVFVLIDAAPSALSAFNQAVGPLTLSPTATLFKVGRLPASGTLTKNLPSPVFGVSVRSFFMQGVFLPPAPIIELGTPTHVHVLDPVF